MEKKKPDVSVVVPVYNSAEYLDECIGSLLRQTLQNTELIFVDDGSDDRSAEIIEEYRSRDSRIQLYRQENLFAGIARNNGMAYASGKYLIFLDSDDFFEPQMLEKAFLCAEENSAEIVLFDYFESDAVTKEKRPSQPLHLPKGVFSPRELNAEDLGSIYGVPWNKMFLRSFVESTGLRFQPLKNFNDEYFTKCAVVLSTRMVYLKEHFVNYRVNSSGSLQGKAKKDALPGLGNITAALIAMKQTLTEKGLFRGEVKQFYLREVRWHPENMYLDLLFRGSMPDARAGYELFRENLIPQLLDSPEDLSELSCFTDIYESSGFEDFLLRTTATREKIWQERYAELQERFERSKDYRIGHAALKLPRAVRGWLRKLEN